MRSRSSSTLTTLAAAGLLVLSACDSSTDPAPPGTPDPAEIELSSSEVSFDYLGATTTIEATVLDEEGDPISDATVTWSTSDSEVATVSDEGVIEAIGNGTATVTAESGDAWAEVEVTVSQVAAGVELDVEDLWFDQIGATAEVSATVFDAGDHEIPDAEVVWSSSDEAVFTIDEDGVVEAVGEGTATLWAESGEASTSIEVTVEVEG